MGINLVTTPFWDAGAKLAGIGGFLLAVSRGVSSYLKELSLNRKKYSELQTIDALLRQRAAAIAAIDGSADIAEKNHLEFYIWHLRQKLPSTLKRSKRFRTKN